MRCAICGWMMFRQHLEPEDGYPGILRCKDRDKCQARWLSRNVRIAARFMARRAGT